MTDTPPYQAPLTTDEATAYLALVAGDPTTYTIADYVTWLNGDTSTPAKFIDWLNTLAAGQRYAWILQIRQWLGEGGA